RQRGTCFSGGAGLQSCKEGIKRAAHRQQRFISRRHNRSTEQELQSRIRRNVSIGKEASIRQTAHFSQGSRRDNQRSIRRPILIYEEQFLCVPSCPPWLKILKLLFENRNPCHPVDPR